MRKPLAVLASDIHYTLQTLALADQSLAMALDMANKLNVPTIIPGDLHDTKANLRGECANAMIRTLCRARTPTYILIGNHDLINEKSEEHSLNFLRAYATIIDAPQYAKEFGAYLIPYQSDVSELRDYIRGMEKGSATLIMHQGLQGSNAGEYFKDHSALNPNDVAGFRVISGHYHNRQTIELPDGGKWDYVGNPYTLNFGEARDPEKGFQILYDDESLEFVPTNLRKHRIFELNVHWLTDNSLLRPGAYGAKDDLWWVKIHDTYENLSTITRAQVAAALGLDVFKLDLIVTKAEQKEIKSELTKGELLDELINNGGYSEERKERLKELWRRISSQ